MEFTTAWAWPQWTFFILMVLQMVICTGLHGRERSGHYNGFAAIVGFGLTMFVLASGGFF